MASALSWRPTMPVAGGHDAAGFDLPNGADMFASSPQLPDPSVRCEDAWNMVQMLHGTTTLSFKYKYGVVVAVTRARSARTLPRKP